jgi:hypothetical protein
MRKMHPALPILIMVLTAALMVGVLTVRPEAAPGWRYFPQSGHIVAAELAAFYRAHGDALVFGPPIGPALFLKPQPSALMPCPYWTSVYVSSGRYPVFLPPQAQMARLLMPFASLRAAPHLAAPVPHLLKARLPS